MDTVKSVGVAIVMVLLLAGVSSAQLDSLRVSRVASFNSGAVYNISQQGDTIFVAQNYDGSMWVDVSDPTDPVTRFEFAEGMYNNTSVIAVGDTVLAMDSGNREIFLIDKSEPDNIHAFGDIDVVDWSEEMDVNGDLIVCTSLQEGVRTIDWSDPNDPVIGHFHQDGWHYGEVHLVGEIAFVGLPFSGLMSLDCSDPANPVMLDHIADPAYGGVYTFDIRGDLAFRPAEDGFITYDISDPANLEFHSFSWTQNINHAIGELRVDGDFLYLAHHFYEPGLAVYNCSDLENIYLTGYYDTEGTNDPMGAVCVDGDYVYVGYWANSDYGWVDVFDVSAAKITLDTPEDDAELPVAFHVLPAYPNPFNATMSVPFELARPGEVTVSLFNSLGRQVYSETLNRHAGRHRFQLAPNQSLASGQYLLRMSSAGVNHSQKVVLLK